MEAVSREVIENEKRELFVEGRQILAHVSDPFLDWDTGFVLDHQEFWSRIERFRGWIRKLKVFLRVRVPHSEFLVDSIDERFPFEPLYRIHVPEGRFPSDPQGRLAFTSARTYEVPSAAAGPNSPWEGDRRRNYIASTQGRTAFYRARGQLEISLGKVEEEIGQLVEGYAIADPKANSTPDEMDDRLPLLRRRVFDRDLSELEAKGNELPLALVMIDLDHFKRVNDTHGHQVGDEVLLEVSEIIVRCVVGKGKAYRYGGEEIVLSLSNYSSEEALALSERIRAEITAKAISSKQISVTASLGVACLPEHARDTKGLLKRCDDAMYDAKSLGRNCVRVSGEPPPREAQARTAKRRVPGVGALSGDDADKIRHKIRQDYFQNQFARCPKDQAVLKIIEDHLVGYKTPHLWITCPLCGLNAELEGDE